MDQTAQDPLRKTFRRGINRRDPAEMNRNFLIVFNHLEFGVLHADALPAQTWLAKDDQALTGQNHLLHIMQIEPAQGERLAQGVRGVLLQGRLENLFPTPEAEQAGFHHFAAEANRLIAFFPRKAGELAPILVTPRIVSQQIAHRLEPEATQLHHPRARNPVDLA